MIMFTRKENSQTIGIYEEKDLKVFVHCAADIIIDHSIEIRSDGQWLLYVLTNTGNLYIARKDQVDQCTRKSNIQSSEQIEIFSDLLGEGDVDNEIKLNLSSQPVYILDESDIIVGKTENPVGICASSKYLVIVTGSALEYTVHLYEKSETGTCINERIAKLSKNISSENINHSSDSVLIKVITCRCIDDGDLTFSRDLIIDVTLFKQLFGEDTALLNSPVILFTQSDGSVYFIPMSSFVPRCSLNSSSFENVSLSETWTLLCQLSSSVTEIALVSLGKGDESSVSLLCICGHDGQVTVFRSDNGNPEYSVSEVFISGPVLSVMSFHNRLYYTSGCNLFESTLDVHARVDAFQRNKQVEITKTKVLSGKYITEIHAASSNGYVDSQESPCCLHCSSLTGEMNVIETSTWMDIDTDTTTSKKDTLKDILISIDEIDNRRQAVKNESKAQENTLRQLGIASYLMAVYENQVRKGMKEAEITVEENTGANEVHMSVDLPICVTFRASASTNVESELTDIRVEVINQMSAVLSDGWTLRASVITTAEESYSVSTSMKIASEWKQNEKIILTLPVSFNEILTGCKLLVKATFLTDSLIRNSCSEKDNADRLCISVPLFESDIDILDCLNPSSASTTSKVHLSQYTNKLYLQLKKQAKERFSKLNFSSVQAGIDEVTVHTRNVINVSISETGGKDKTNEARPALLGKLLGKALSDISDIQPSNCHFMTTAGHSIQLSVLAATNDRSSEHKDGETFDVIVRGTPRIAAAVHRAIGLRESHLTQSFGSRPVPEIWTNQARKAMQTAQETANQISPPMIEKATFMSAFQKMRNVNL